MRWEDINVTEVDKLDEKYATTEYTFGCELEAIALDLPSAKLMDKKAYRANQIALHNIFKPYFPNDRIPAAVHERSIETDRGFPFEFNAPPMNADRDNLKIMKRFLVDLPKHNIVTNDTCAFHIHLKAPELSEEDMTWIVLHLALGQNRELLTKFVFQGKEIKFTNKKHADDAFLDEIKSVFYSGGQEKWQKLGKLLGDTKQRVLRMHPQGTMEWRGPRSFLEGQNPRMIIAVFNQLIQVIEYFDKILDETHLMTMPRSEVFSKLKVRKIVDPDRMVVPPTYLD